jgi:TM2 domain-containing membrane protein YozV
MPKQAAPETKQSAITVSSKSSAIILAWLLGYLGVDRFYFGDIGFGIAKLLTLGGCGVWSMIDAILVITGSRDKDANGHYLVDRKTIELMKTGQLKDSFGNLV